MLIFVGEGDELGLDAGAVTRANALNLTIIERRIRQAFAEARMNSFVGVGDEAGKLRNG